VDLETGLLDELDKVDEIVAVREVILSLHRLVAVPEDEGLHQAWFHPLSADTCPPEHHTLQHIWNGQTTDK
jgi:hypothetical protein